MDNFTEDDRGNRIYNSPTLESTKVVFSGRNNILFCDSNVKVQNSILEFKGEGSVIYLSSNSHPYHLNVAVYSDSAVAFGREAYLNGRLNAVTSERKNFIVGENCLFSFGIWVRTADAHLIYDANTHRRVNPSKSVLIGDHVWIGQDAKILKGTSIGSGSIVAAGSVLSGKRIPSNTSWGGVPARQIAEGVFFSSECVHAYTKKKTKNVEKHAGSEWIYSPDGSADGLKELDEKLGAAKGSFEKLQLLNAVFSGEHDKNRFALEKTKPAKTSDGAVSRLANIVRNRFGKGVR